MSVGELLLIFGLACLAVALLAGGLAERIFVAAQGLSGIVEYGVVRQGDVTGAVLTDLAVLAVVAPIALGTDKTWPLVAASLCVAALMSEAAQLLVHASPAAYGVLQSSWDLLADFVVAVGAVNVWRARRASRAVEAGSNA